MKNTTMPIYIGANGDRFCETDLERAFLIVTGKRADENKSEYSGFRDGLFTTGSILEKTYPTVEELVDQGHFVLATKLYRDQNKTTLAEAHKVVMAMRAEKERVE